MARPLVESVVSEQHVSLLIGPVRLSPICNCVTCVLAGANKPLSPCSFGLTSCVGRRFVAQHPFQTPM